MTEREKQEIIVYEPLSEKAEKHIKRKNQRKATTLKAKRVAQVSEDGEKDDLLQIMKATSNESDLNVAPEFEIMDSYLVVEDGRSPEGFSAQDYRVRAGTLSGLISHLVASDYCGT